jgi:type VI secretion system protein ImpK
VQVTGHSDNQPIRTAEFANNQVLSEKRAEAVAAVLKDKGVVDARLTIRGQGDSLPLADNASAAGRARNRRVDVVVTQGGVPPSR